jgi:hypothetical protein
VCTHINTHFLHGSKETLLLDLEHLIFLTDPEHRVYFHGIKRKSTPRPGIVVCIYNPSSWEDKAGGLRV